MHKSRWDRYDLCAGVIIALGIFLRLALILLSWPASYNDEGTLGLMALHIAYNGAHPLLYYGQDYLGSLEAYLGAGLFHLFGPSTAALRLGLIPIFALFLICLYLLAALLYSKGLALFSIVLAALGAPDVLLRQLLAAGGTPEMLFFTTLLLLLTAWLAHTSRPSTLPVKADKSAVGAINRPLRPFPLADHFVNRQRGIGDDTSAVGAINRPLRAWLDLFVNLQYRLPRLIAYGAWGAIAGLDLWSHLLCLPFVLSAGFLLLLFCRRELRLPSLSLLVLCLLIGVSPLLIYKATVPVSPDQLSLFTSMGYHEPSYPPPSPTDGRPQGIAPTDTFSAPLPVLQVAGTLLVAIPVATSGTALCPLSPDDAWPLSDRAGASTRFCTGVYGAWSMGLLVLWCLAVSSAVRSLRSHWRTPPEEERSAKQRREAIRQAARLMLLAGTGLTLLTFASSAQASAVTPWTSARYLVAFLIAIPALLFPLWEKRHMPETPGAWTEYLKQGLRYALLLLIFAACLLGTLTTFTQQVPVAQASYQREDGYIAGLLRLGATHIYTDYEDCNRTAFISDEQIICAVLDKGLKPGLDRYFPYRRMVATWPNVYYAFPDGSAQQVLFERKAAEEHIRYRKFNINGYDVYEPERRIT